MSKDMNLEYSKKETFILLLAILQIHVLRRGLLPLYSLREKYLVKQDESDDEIGREEGCWTRVMREEGEEEEEEEGGGGGEEEEEDNPPTDSINPHPHESPYSSDSLPSTNNHPTHLSNAINLTYDCQSDKDESKAPSSAKADCSPHSPLTTPAPDSHEALPHLATPFFIGRRGIIHFDDDDQENGYSLLIGKSQIMHEAGPRVGLWKILS
ncbi:hypothetical protein PDE_02385 [Penicillium oxalicum 114-2]|uniref:Uncharacterized protein n=1 Tax=Penicillium oxalicum (strain 114-2 / CGMCC 5302) TaxID=933388 RepID=S8AZL2_PENO1|nr:hypothetical protein PDE_02385 [Penicillium oxalicum 114-2]